MWWWLVWKVGIWRSSFMLLTMYEGLEGRSKSAGGYVLLAGRVAIVEGRFGVDDKMEYDGERSVAS